MTSTEIPESIPARVLVVDDLPANLRLLEGILKVAGYEVVTATSGAQALEQMADNCPDVLLLDVMMPDMDGFEVCRRVRAENETSWLPIVMVTALQEVTDRVAALEAGADDFLTKPVEEVEVVARVKSLVRVKRQRDELERSYHDLRRAESMRDALSAMIVHDLRTPLTAVLGAVETLLLSEPDAFQKELIEICGRSSRRLLSLVNDLLDVSKMESGQMVLEKTLVEVEPMVQEALTLTIPFDGKKWLTAQGREIQVETSISTDVSDVEADRDLLCRVLVNLLGNSAKFTPNGGRINLSVEPYRDGHDTDALRFSVKDTGPGIAPEDHERIFEKFGQVERAHAGRRLSTGLGLTFCKLAVEAHGGHIWLESTLGEGSTFHFTIPCSG